jgi:multiple sugar transport system substrate-binding protein
MTSKSTLSRRGFLKLAGMTAAGAVLAACTPTATSTPKAQATATAKGAAVPATGQAITIVYRYLHPEGSQLGEATKRHLQRINNQVPGTNVKVNLEVGIAWDRTFADLAAGTPPDCFWAAYDTSGIVKGIDEGLFVCAEDWLALKGFDFKDFAPGMKDVYTVKGKVWGMPNEQVVVLWATNPKVFKEAGVDPKKDWTWDDVIEYGQRITKDKAGKHPNEAGFNLNEVAVWALQPWQAWVIQEYLPYTAGGQYVDDTRTKAMINSDSFVATLQFLRDIYQKYHIATMSPPDKGLFTGAIAAQETGNWALIDFKKSMDEVGCLYTPVHPGKKIQATPFFDKELWVPKQKDTARIEAANQFAHWFMESYIDFAIDTGYAPFLNSQLNGAKWQEVLKKYPFMVTAMEGSAFAKPRFWSLFDGAVEAQQPLNEMWDAAVNSEKDIKQLVADCNAEVQRIIDKNRAG